VRKVPVACADRQREDGCLKFRGRFGEDALRLVQARETRDRNLRGVYWKVIEPGEVRLGATIEVLCRPV
jgi:MOSC domain-containing protein YiiM